jgi:type IV pilus assembly protein PilF
MSLRSRPPIVLIAAVSGLVGISEVVSLGGCASNEENVKKANGYYQQGLADLDTDQQRAFVAFQKAVQYDPRHRDAHYYLGHIYAHKGKLTSAEEEFREVLRIDPDYSEAHHYLGEVLASQNRWHEAIESYRRALSNPLYATPDLAWFKLGLAFAHEGDMEKAAQAFEDARVVTPASVPAGWLNLELGRAYYKLGYNAKAQEALSRAVSLDKGGPYAMEADKLLERLKP